MANDGLEKITEVPYEFVKEGQTFIQRCKKPDANGTFYLHSLDSFSKTYILTPNAS